MNTDFDIEPEEFQQRKRRRMSAMNNAAPPAPKVAPTSAPGVHEVATFLPGRLEFEHELDNEAEELVKDLEFGICLAYGGDQIIEDENDVDVKARAQMLEERKASDESRSISQPPTNGVNGYVNGYGSVNGDTSRPHSVVKSEEPGSTDQQTTGEDDPNSEEPTQPPPYETEDSLTFKLTMIEMYNQRVAKRHEAKAIMFERGLLEYKKVGLFASVTHDVSVLPMLTIIKDASCREETGERGEGHCTTPPTVCQAPDRRRLRSVRCGHAVYDSDMTLMGADVDSTRQMRQCCGSASKNYSTIGAWASPLPLISINSRWTVFAVYVYSHAAVWSDFYFISPVFPGTIKGKFIAGLLCL